MNIKGKYVVITIEQLISIYLQWSDHCYSPGEDEKMMMMVAGTGEH